MLVINKKRLEIILSCVIISILAFSFKIAGTNITNANQENNENSNVIETVSTPVSGKTVVLDARAWYTR
jgi:hypothetical protein